MSGLGEKDDIYEGMHTNNHGKLGNFVNVLFNIPYHFLHSTCKYMGRSLKLLIENMQW